MDNIKRIIVGLDSNPHYMRTKELTKKLLNYEVFKKLNYLYPNKSFLIKALNREARRLAEEKTKDRTLYHFRYSLTSRPKTNICCIRTIDSFYYEEKLHSIDITAENYMNELSFINEIHRLFNKLGLSKYNCNILYTLVDPPGYLMHSLNGSVLNAHCSFY